jgi:hypothetical protein
MQTDNGPLSTFKAAILSFLRAIQIQKVMGNFQKVIGRGE